MYLSKKIISLPIHPQYFPFFPTFMKYILQNSSPKLLLKFYQCCKCFYYKLRINIASNVWFHPKENKIKCGFYQLFPNTEQLWLCDKLHVFAPSKLGIIGNGFLNKIYRNNLKTLFICSGFTLFKELKILSKSHILTEVILQTFVKNENDEPIPIEEIMVLFPKIKEFGIYPPHFTMESFEKLLTFKFLNKINSLEFRCVKTEFDAIAMCKFLQDVFDENAEFRLIFDSHELENQLLPHVEEIIEGWKTNKPKCFFK